MTTAYAFSAGPNNPVSGVSIPASSYLTIADFAPAFGDLDGDGDLDLVMGVTVDALRIVTPGVVRYFENVGSAQMPRFEYQSGNRSPFYHVRLISGQTTPTLVDLDADGDLDLVMGDRGGDLNYYRNVGSATAPSFKKVSTGSGPFRGIDIGAESAPTLGDLDGDGDLDMVVGGKYGRLTHFNNVGNITTPAFERTGLLDGVDVGDKARPTLLDLDRDGDLDLVVGEQGDGGYTRVFSYFENAGSATAPTFAERNGADNPFHHLRGEDDGDRFTRPAFADLDGDGAPDLVFGRDHNSLGYFEGLGTVRVDPLAPLSWRAAAVSPFSGIDVGEDAAPAFVDLDRDGDLDLVVGEDAGNINYYRNVGDAATPRYEAQHGTDNPFAGIDVGGESVPLFADLDGDGDPDLVTGANDGRISYYQNSGSAKAPWFEERPGTGNPFNGINVGGDSAPTLADLDRDGDLDLVVGDAAGYLRYYENTGNARAPAFSTRATNGFAFNDVDLGEDPRAVFADLDRDGDLDLLAGREAYQVTGTIYYYENTGSARLPAFARRTGADNPFRNISGEEFNLVPALADVDGDGLLELVIGHNQGALAYYRPFASRESYAWNVAGQVVRTDFDNNNDGAVDRSYFDPDADGTVDRIEEYVRDDQGNLVRIDFDDDADGTADRSETPGDAAPPPSVAPPEQPGDAAPPPSVSTPDDPGADELPRVHEVDEDRDGHIDWISFDTDGDGAFDRVEVYVRNDNGDVILTGYDDDADGHVDRDHFDPNADGAVDRIETHTWDGNGRIARTAFDDDADGTADRIETYVRNRDGDVIETGFDSDADGIVNRREFDADADGAPERTATDADDDGTMDRAAFDPDEDGTANRIEHDNDGDGRTDRVEFDANDDGAVDRIESHTRDGGGRITRTEFDDDADGAADRIESYGRDSAGRIIRTEFDDDADGAADRIESYTLDSAGRIARTAFDDNADSTLDRIETYVRNSAGDVIQTDVDSDADGIVNRREFDANADGTPERTEVDADDDGTMDRVEFDANENGTAERIEYDDDGDGPADRARIDADEDGTVDRTESYVRNGDGGVIQIDIDDDADGRTDRTHFDANADGAVERTEAYARLPNGHIRRTDFDDDADGAVDRIETYLRYPNGNVLRADFDDDADGTTDRIEVYVRNGQGQVIRMDADDDADNHIDRTIFDANADGTPERTISYARNSDGDIIRTDYDDNGNGQADRTHFDPNGDGVLDRIETYYERDEQGNSLRTGFDDDADNTVDRIESYVRDVKGRIIRADFDDDADNTVDRVEVYAWNTAGAVIGTYYDDDVDGVIDRAAFDDEGDGTVDRIETYSYDAHGNLIKKVMAVGGEGDEAAVEAPAPDLEEAGGPSLGRSAADGPGARGVAGKETGAAGEAGARTPFEAMLDDLGEGAVIRSETYTRNAAGVVVRTDYDEGDDGIVERSSVDDAGDGVIDEHRYDHDANGSPDWVGRDSDNDGMIEQLEFHGQWGAAGHRVTHTITLLGAGPAYTVAFHDGDGLLLASGWSATGPGALDGFAYSAGLDVVSELQTAASAGSADALLPVDATLLASVSHIDLAGAGAGSTDLTISDAALSVLADGDGNYQLRIDGDNDDTLRFDLDDFTRGDDIAVAGENYEQYAGTTGSFIVDPDVTLVIA